MEEKFLGELGRGAAVAAHDLAEILEGCPRLVTDLPAPLHAVLPKVGLSVHGRKDIRKTRRLQALGANSVASRPAIQSGMDVKAIRRKNLQLLKLKEGTLDAIGKRADIDPNYLSQINSGYRAMGDATARKLESAYGHSHGWMDTLQPGVVTNGSNVEPITKTLRRVPLISWVSAGQQAEVFDPYQPGAAESWEEIEGPVSQYAFALRVRGDSMMAPDGQGFPDGAVIIIEPKLEPRHRDFVIARFVNSNEATFKQYIVDGPNVILRALNPAYPPILVTADTHITGVVTETLMRRRLRG